jgi:hypothetical protein
MRRFEVCRFWLPLTLLFAPFSASAGSNECKPGIVWYWGGLFVATVSSCSFDSANRSGTKVISADGSYVPVYSGSHQFWFWAETYSLSFGSGTPYPRLLFDTIGSGSLAYDSGYQRPAWESPSFAVIRDFRYPFRFLIDDAYTWQRARVEVNTGTGYHVLSADDGLEDCYLGGCRDTGLARTPFECRLSPSHTIPRSSSPTNSHSPAPTVSGSPAPSATQEYLPGPLSRGNLIIRIYTIDLLLRGRTCDFLKWRTYSGGWDRIHSGG